MAIVKIFLNMAEMAPRHNMISSCRDGNIWLSTCSSADNKGEAANAALTVATPCHLHIYSTKNALK